jgi:hypothetical protein
VINHLLKVLHSVRDRNSMYFRPVDVVAAENFLNGFITGVASCGLEVPIEIRESTTLERGWKWYAARPVDDMRNRGLTEDQIIDEILTIEIAAWRVYKG